MTYTIEPRYEHLADTPAGIEAVEVYEQAVASGTSHTEAEVLASNVLQRAGFNVNAKGGASIYKDGVSQESAK